MEPSNLTPFVQNNLDILFVGLNPATGSSRNGHYFSVNQAFWNQLYDAGLITSYVDKANADQLVFGGSKVNFRGWAYGVTDLVTSVAESESKRVRPTPKDCEEMKRLISRLAPKVVILLHGKVVKVLLPSFGYPVPTANSGKLGQLISNCPTMFFNIAFPHGNAIPSIDKVAHYRKVKEYLLTLQ